jgi:hypothetical protein
MKRTLRWSLGLILTVGFTGVGQTVTAGSPETSLTLTIHVYNYAAVDDKTLAQAEQVAIGIFRKAGVEILWISENNQSGSVDHGLITLSHIQLNILPSPMAAVLNLPDKVMGVAPGTERNRQVIYVFYNRVEALSQKLATSRREASRNRFASFPIYPVATPQILGHAIAHELGHVLLNIETHSKIGIMRGDWNSEDLQDIYFGFLIFTSQQAEIIRKEVTRRAREALQEAPSLSGVTMAR